MSLTNAAAFLVSCVGLATGLASQGVAQLADVNATPGSTGRYDFSSRPTEFTEVGGQAIFAAKSPATGRELFATQGTPATTALLKDLNPGRPHANPRELTLVGTTCFFAARTSSTGDELFKTDGTAAGTVLVRDIVPGTMGSNPLALTPLGGVLYFLLGDGSFDLWRSDGTAQGTALVAKTGARTAGTSSMVAPATGKYVFFTIGNDVWISDGTTNGTRRYATLGAPPGLSATTSTAYMWDEQSLWRCDVTGPTVIHSVSAPARILVRATAADVLYFEVHYPSPNGSFSFLHKATAAAVSLVDTLSSSVIGFATDGSDYYYAPKTTSTTKYSIWRVNATSKSLAVDIPGSPVVSSIELEYIHRGILYSWTWGGSTLVATNLATQTTLPLMTIGFPGEYGTVGSRVVFAGTRLGDIEPYATDGIPANTGQLADLCPKTNGVTLDSRPHHFFDVSGEAFFYASEPLTGGEFYRTDGTAKGTKLLMDVVPGAGSTPDAAMGRLGNQLFFDGGNKLWVSDGTAAGTKLLKDVPSPWHFSQLGGYLYFNSGFDLWRTDGTAGGTTLVRKQTLVFSEAIDGHLYLRGNGPGGWEPWRFDGTTFTMLGDLDPNGDSRPQDFLRAGDHVVFQAVVPGLYIELFTVPIAGGKPTLLKDLHPGVPSHGGHLGVSIGDKMFFWDQFQGTAQLYVTDGTTNGTVGLPITTTQVQFVGEWGAGQVLVQTESAVWTTDGTVAGTRKFADLRGQKTFQALRVGSRRVAFQASDGDHGYELWMSDGTTAGTKMVVDLFPGPGDGCSPTGPSRGGVGVSNGRLLFPGDDGLTGEEPYALELGAVSQRVGVGCRARGFVPRLSAEDPVLGASIAIHVDEATANTSGVLVAGAPLLGFRSAYLGSGCSLYVDFAVPILMQPLRTDAGGRWTLRGVTIPNNPALQGVRFMLQAGLGPSVTPPMGVDLTGGVLMVIGL